jgi:DNA-binding CsgD family transcriptional regulator
MTKPRRSLSVRELEVVSHLADGLTYNEVAGALYFSKPTVKSHAARARQILGARNTAQLCVLAIRSGQLP